MKLFIVLFLFIIIWNSGRSQTTYELRLPMEDHQMLMDMVEQQDRLILIIGENNSGDLFSTRIMVIEANGDTMSINISKQDTGVLGYKVLPFENGNFMIATSNYLLDTNGTSAFLNLEYYSHDLLHLKSLSNSIPAKYVNLDIRTLLIENTFFLIGGFTVSQYGIDSSNDFFICLIDSLGQIIKSHYYDNFIGPEIVCSIEKDSMNNQFVAIGDGFSIFSGLQCLKIDTNLIIKEIIDMPAKFESPAQLYLKSPNEIVLTNAYRNIASLNPDTRVNIALLDSTMQLQANMYWDSVESYDPPAWFKSLAVLDDGSYAVGGTIQIWFRYQPSWFVLGRATEGLLGMWERYYGGDYYYNMCNMIRTHDGGYAMGGFYSDTLNPQDQGIYVLKVNADGLLNGMTDSDAFDHSVIVWYDPAHHRLMLRTALPEPLNLRILDITGRLVYEKTGIRGDQYLHLPELGPGAYLYEVTDPGYHRKSGKFLIP